MRFDDTNPAKEEQEYIDSIQSDVRWLGYDWAGEPFYASDYFDRLYEWAEGLIQRGLAYVDDQSQHDIRVNRGTLTEPGKDSPFRDRSVEENLDLFRRMKAGEFPNGARVLRAKIDMAAGNINLRDPCCTASCMRIIRAPAPNGRSIQATTMRTASRMPSKASRIRSARWSSRTTGRCTTGSSKSCRCRPSRISMNLRVSI